MKKERLLSILLIAGLIAGCSQKTEETTEAIETTVAETTTVETTEETTTVETTEETTTETTAASVKTASPFDEESAYDYSKVNELSDDELQYFYDLFYTEWFYGIEGDPEAVSTIGDVTVFEVSELNYRPAWLYTSYNDPRDCNPYVAADWLQHDGFQLDVVNEEDIGVAFVSKYDVIDAQIKECTGFSNSELDHPMGKSASFNGTEYVVFGPHTNGGWGQDKVLSGVKTEDGKVILLVGYQTDKTGTTSAITVLEPNEDGTYRFVNNHRLNKSLIIGSTEEEISSEDLRENIMEQVGKHGYNSIFISEEDYQYDIDESLRFSAYLSRNVYLAAHGVIFEDPLLNFWFGAYSWYEPTVSESEFDYSELSAIELHNVNEADALLEELS